MNKLFIMIIMIAILLSACSKDYKPAPVEKSGTPPGVVTNISVENKPGVAIVSYALPKDQDLLYVKAVYQLPNGTKREVKSSYYNNFVRLDGFAEQRDYKVNIYTVNRSDVESAPVEVTVKPLPSPIYDVFNSLNVQSTFGGINVQASNPEKYEVAIETFWDSLGHYVPVKSIYTSTNAINRNIRGLPAVQRDYYITVRDRWLNYTDTIKATLKPTFESAIPNANLSDANFPNDAIPGWNFPKSVLWDNGANNTWIWGSAYSTSQINNVDTAWISFKMEKARRLSRMVMWVYPEGKPLANGLWYYRGNPRLFEIWGSANPAPDGSWDNWVRLGTFENIKPSGLPHGELNQEDRDAAIAGFNYDFEVTTVPIQYLRIKNLESWGGFLWFTVAQIQLYGAE